MIFTVPETNIVCDFLVSEYSWVPNRQGVGLENDYKCCRKGYGSLSQMCIKVILPSPKNEKGWTTEHMKADICFHIHFYAMPSRTISHMKVGKDVYS